jgi:hypothetical protein
VFKTLISGCTCFGLTRSISCTCIYKNIEKIVYNTIKFRDKVDISLSQKYLKTENDFNSILVKAVAKNM